MIYLHVHSPVLSGFIPSLVGSIGTENEKKTKRSTGERKGVHGKGKSRYVVRVDQRSVVDLVEVIVSNCQHVPKKDNSGDRRGSRNLSGDIL